MITDGELTSRIAEFTQSVNLTTVALAVAVWGIKRFVTQVEKLSQRLDASIESNHRMHQKTLRMLHQTNEDVAVLKYKSGMDTSFHPPEDAKQL